MSARQTSTDAVAGHLVSQRNAIAMLYERMQVIQQYVKRNPDPAITRQVASLMATLPIMDATEFRQELETVRRARARADGRSSAMSS